MPARMLRGHGRSRGDGSRAGRDAAWANARSARPSSGAPDHARPCRPPRHPGRLPPRGLERASRRPGAPPPRSQRPAGALRPRGGPPPWLGGPLHPARCVAAGSTPPRVVRRRAHDGPVMVAPAAVPTPRDDPDRARGDAGRRLRAPGGRADGPGPRFLPGDLPGEGAAKPAGADPDDRPGRDLAGGRRECPARAGRDRRLPGDGPRDPLPLQVLEPLVPPAFPPDTANGRRAARVTTESLAATLAPAVDELETWSAWTNARRPLPWMGRLFR
jgi:hypothetical protein